MSDAARCAQCFLKTAACLCADIPRGIASATAVRIVRHHHETHKASNTARLAAMCLARCDLLDYGAPGRPFDDAPLREPGTWLLFAEGAPRLTAPSESPRQLVVLDGNWPQARRMRRRIDALRGMPVLSLPPPQVAPDRLRAQPHAEGMATVEAIAHALAFLGDRAAADALSEVYATFVERTLRTARFA